MADATGFAGAAGSTGCCAGGAVLTVNRALMAARRAGEIPGRAAGALTPAIFASGAFASDACACGDFASAFGAGRESVITFAAFAFAGGCAGVGGAATAATLTEATATGDLRVVFGAGAGAGLPTALASLRAFGAAGASVMAAAPEALAALAGLAGALARLGAAPARAGASAAGSVVEGVVVFRLIRRLLNACPRAQLRS
ncbi:hypothetical protein [Ancylobacter sp. TS-1]|uniref:hypothetical protein n=1 Tax=Ancylobacter sp. TS-1 TaxID=1850374 RepID=UPI001391B6D3|nr:hypothetical protein [Ancylobacter sp. TS-1]